VELGCSGTILKEISLGKLLLLICEELGTRGSAEIRDQEANAAAKFLGFLLEKSGDARRFC
jgi:LmbE family N-acetylglucosaminyl deacetylase